MRDYIEERALEIGENIIEEGATVRQAARKFGISKSTVHKDVTERLKQINLRLAHEARKVLDVNKSERHIRGGLATKEKYAHMDHGLRLYKTTKNDILICILLRNGEAMRDGVEVYDSYRRFL